MRETTGKSASELKAKLTAEQYHVTQQCGTEPPFENAYWDNHEPGIYVDVVSGEPLFSSLDKFDSGTGWPSFTRPLESGNLVRREDRSFIMRRVEVRSRNGNSHLGHVFDDGPAPTRQRYCINSAALRFVPASKLAQEGYARYAALFADAPASAKRTTSAAPAARAEPTVSAVAVLAGGCFWGVEDLLRKLPGVIDTEVGYAGGTRAKPTYEDVKTGFTGHAEAVRVVFDPTRLSYAELLRYYFRLHDPTTLNRQGHDVDSQYRSAIFVADEEQREVAQQVRDEVNAQGRWKGRVVTEIVKAGEFYPAEGYHQDFLEKHPNGYTCHYLRD